MKKVTVILSCRFGDKKSGEELVLDKNVADGLIAAGNATLVLEESEEDLELEQELNDAKVSISEANSKVEALEAQLVESGTKVEGLEAQLVESGTKVEALEAEIVTLKTKKKK